MTAGEEIGGGFYFENAKDSALRGYGGRGYGGAAVRWERIVGAHREWKTLGPFKAPTF